MNRRFLLIALLLACTLPVAAGKKHPYLFAWCGDDDKKASDFLAVIDADPASLGYGQGSSDCTYRSRRLGPAPHRG